MMGEGRKRRGRACFRGKVKRCGQLRVLGLASWDTNKVLLGLCVRARIQQGSLEMLANRKWAGKSARG